MCDALGIWCIIVISEANPEKKIKYRHAWNIVKIGKTYYHLDATFDLSLSKTLTRHDYFNLSDDAIFRDHEPIMTEHVPCTDGSHFYYLEKKLSFTKQEEVKKRATQAVSYTHLDVYKRQAESRVEKSSASSDARVSFVPIILL